MTPTTTTKPASPCPVSGYPRETVTTTKRIFVLRDPVVGRVELVDDCTLEDAQEVARFSRDKLGRQGVRLARETVTETKTQFAGEWGEVYADRLAAGEFDPV